MALGDGVQGMDGTGGKLCDQHDHGRRIMAFPAIGQNTGTDGAGPAVDTDFLANVGQDRT